mgnify:CR=1 FL=1
MATKLTDKYLKGFVNEHEYEGVAAEVKAAHKVLHDGTGLGNDFLGWLNLPTDYDKEEFARIKAAAEKIKCVEYDGLIINLTNYSVVCDGQQVDMPPKELELLYFLASSPNQVFTREQLLDQIWGYEYIGDTRTVDVHIKRLRAKIKNHDSWGLSTVWGIGYKFETK